VRRPPAISREEGWPSSCNGEGAEKRDDGCAAMARWTAAGGEDIERSMERPWRRAGIRRRTGAGFFSGREHGGDEDRER
jgi:hypothetical protein